MYETITEKIKLTNHGGVIQISLREPVKEIWIHTSILREIITGNGEAAEVSNE